MGTLTETYIAAYNDFVEMAKDSEKMARESKYDFDKCLFLDSAIEEYETAQEYLDKAYKDCDYKSIEFEKYTNGEWHSNMKINILTKIIGLTQDYYKYAKNIFERHSDEISKLELSHELFKKLSGN